MSSRGKRGSCMYLDYAKGDDGKGTTRKQAKGVRGGLVALPSEQVDGDDLSGFRCFSWSSAAPEVPGVSGDAIGYEGGATCFVTGLSDGTATITTTSQRVTGRLAVTVRKRVRVSWTVPLEWSFPGGTGEESIGGRRHDQSGRHDVGVE